MKWSIKLGRVLGIDLYMHLTFLLIIAYVAYMHYAAGENLAGVLSGIAFVLAIFACVVMHEYGHALTARQFGVKTKDITLLPIGGVARLERIPEKPLQEFLVAVAGPAVNIAIAGVIFVLLTLTNSLEPFERVASTGGSFLERLMFVNIALVIFNMLPAFPMDGGRVVRSLLATQMDYVSATNYAAATGKVMAVLFAIMALFAPMPFNNPFLLLIALFVWMGASQEAAMAQIKSALTGVPVFRIMQSRFARLAPMQTVEEAANLSLTTGQHRFPILQGDTLVGVVGQQELIHALDEQGPSALIETVMERNVSTIDATSNLDDAFQKMQQSEGQTLVVLHHGQVVGLLTPEGINDYLRLGLRPQRSDANTIRADFVAKRGHAAS